MVASTAKLSLDQQFKSLERCLQVMWDETKKVHRGLRDDLRAKQAQLQKYKARFAVEKGERGGEKAAEHAQSRPVFGLPLDEAFVEQLIDSVEMACATRQPKVAEAALEVARILVAHGYVSNTVVAPIVDGIKKVFINYVEDPVRVKLLMTLESAVLQPRCGLHGSLLMDAMRTCYNVTLFSRTVVPTSVNTSTSTNVQGTSTNVQGEESKTAAEAVSEVSHAPAESPYEQAYEVLRRIVLFVIARYLAGGDELAAADAGLFFRALCKLASRPWETRMELMDARSKILALRVLKDAVEQLGTAMRGKPQFERQYVRRYLAPVLMINARAHVRHPFRLTLQLFLLVLSYFKNLRAVISEAFQALLLAPLAADSTAPMELRLSVLQAAERVCHSPQMVVDIFSNYDCDGDFPDVMERLVHRLAAVAVEVPALRPSAVQCLSTAAVSLANRASLPAAQNPSGAGLSLAERRKQRKKLLLQGIEMFSAEGGKRAVPFLIESGVLSPSPEAVAVFLRDHAPDLSDSAVGEYIDPKSDDFRSKVLSAYLGLFSFRDVPIDVAMRQFLYGFKPAGEAQVLDRVLERFAQYYVGDNPGSTMLPTADHAFIFAFSVMQLATTQHNPMARQFRFTAETWIANNHHVSAAHEWDDFSHELQTEVFDRVNETAFRTVQQARAIPGAPNVWANALPGPTIAAAAKDAAEKAKADDVEASPSAFVRSSSPSIVRPLFENVSDSMLKTFADLLENDADPAVMDACLSGYAACVHVACSFGMHDCRNAFVKSLAVFTRPRSLSTVSRRTVESARVLLKIALDEESALGRSWRHVIATASHFARFGLLPDASAPPTPSKAAPSPSPAAVDTPAEADGDDAPGSGSAEEEEARLTKAAERALRGLDFGRVLLVSRQLTNEGLLDYLRALCAAGASELVGDVEQSRFFATGWALRVLSDDNGHRLAKIWSSAWPQVYQLVVTVPAGAAEAVVAEVVRRLLRFTTRVLDSKDMGEDRAFQGDLMGAYVDIMYKHPIGAAGRDEAAVRRNLGVRVAVLEALDMVVNSRGKSLVCGWDRVLSAVKVAATDPIDKALKLSSDRVLSAALEVANDVFDMEPTFAAAVAAGQFAAAAHSLSLLARCAPAIKDVNVPAMDVVVDMAERVRDELLPLDSPDAQYSADDARACDFWTALCRGLADVVWHVHIDVRSAALQRLFSVVNNYGKHFAADLWAALFRTVLLPMFDGVVSISPGRRKKALVSADEWIITTCMNAAQSLVGLYARFFSETADLLPDVVQLFGRFIASQNITLAEIGCTSLLSLVTSVGASFTPEMWDGTTRAYQLLMAHTLPLEVFLSHQADIVPSESSSPKTGSTPPKPDVSKESTKAVREAVDQVALEHVVGADEIASALSTTLASGTPEIVRDRVTLLTRHLDELASASDAGEGLALGKALATPAAVTAGARRRPRGCPAWISTRVASRLPDFNLRVVKVRSDVYLHLVRALSTILIQHVADLSASAIARMLEAIYVGHGFAFVACSDAHVRRALGSSDVMKALINVEITSTTVYLQSLFSLFNEDDDARVLLARPRLMAVLETVLVDFRENVMPWASPYARMKVPLVQQSLALLLAAPAPRFHELCDIFYDLLIDLVASDRLEVRSALMPILRRSKTNN